MPAHSPCSPARKAASHDPISSIPKEHMGRGETRVALSFAACVLVRPANLQKRLTLPGKGGGGDQAFEAIL